MVKIGRLSSSPKLGSRRRTQARASSWAGQLTLVVGWRNPFVAESFRHCATWQQPETGARTPATGFGGGPRRLVRAGEAAARARHIRSLPARCRPHTPPRLRAARAPESWHNYVIKKRTQSALFGASPSCAIRAWSLTPLARRQPHTKATGRPHGLIGGDSLRHWAAARGRPKAPGRLREVLQRDSVVLAERVHRLGFRARSSVRLGGPKAPVTSRLGWPKMSELSPTSCVGRGPKFAANSKRTESALSASSRAQNNKLPPSRQREKSRPHTEPKKR